MYAIPTFEEIRAAYLRDILNLLPDAAVDPDSDHFIRATATSSAVDGLYHHQLWIARQILPDTADSEYLERHAALRGITRKPAVAAVGQLVVSGAPGAVIPAGEVVRHTLTELAFFTTAQAMIDPQGQAGVAVTAATAGAMPAFVGEPVLFVQAPAGVQGQALLTLSGGVPAETDVELLARLLDYMRNPPGGGNVADYRRWALAVPGISRAWTIPARRGLGTVDVAVLGPQGPASAEAVAAAQAVVDANRPAACPDAWVLSPTPLLVNVTVAARLDAGCICSLWDGTNGWAVILYGNGYGLSFNYGSSLATTVLSNDSPDTTLWNHCAVVRRNGTLFIYRNGVLKASGTLGAVTLPSTVFRVGAYSWSGGYSYFSGQIANLRVTKGLARWTRDFTPPVRPY